MKRQEKIKLTRKVTIRLKQHEYELLHAQYKKTACRKFSFYARSILLEKPIVTKIRNLSADEFLAVALQLKNEFSAVGNNYNQAVKKLHLLHDPRDLKEWVLGYESQRLQLHKKADEIFLKMDQIYQLWLRG